MEREKVMIDPSDWTPYSRLIDLNNISVGKRDLSIHCNQGL